VPRDEQRVRIQMSVWSDLAGKASSGFNRGRFPGSVSGAACIGAVSGVTEALAAATRRRRDFAVTQARSAGSSLDTELDGHYPVLDRSSRSI
jgi:hypothetical protein